MNKQRIPGPQKQTPQQVVQHGVSNLHTRPTDISISKNLDEIIPEVGLYRQLLDAEKRLDIFTSRKLSDLQETLIKQQSKKQLLRIFIYNTAENQPWQKQGTTTTTTTEPSWTLRVEGRLVNKDKAEDPARKKFSSFLSGIAIDLQPNSTQQGQPIIKENVIEWHEQTDPNIQNVEFDGLDVKRNGDVNIPAKITIQPKELPIKLKTSKELSELLGSSELSQHDALYFIWQYIQFNNLQNPEDKKIINCDENLSKLFNVPRFEFKDLLTLLSKHLSPKPPIVLDYEIKVDKASTLGDLVVDIEVPVDDLPDQVFWRDEIKKINNLDESIKNLNSKIILGVQSLNNNYKKYQFFNNLSIDPITFFNKFNESHSNLLKILTGDEGYNENNVRNSDFYTDELLSENVDILLKTHRI